MIPIGSVVCLNKLSQFTGFAKLAMGLGPRPCDTEALGRSTAPMRIGHVELSGKSENKLASNRHMALVIDFAELASETSKSPGHIANPVLLRFLYI